MEDYFNQALAQSMFNKNNAEKTVIDKILGKGTIDEIKAIMIKSPLTREDLLKVLYLLASEESKLHNLGARERYVLLKFYVWVREFGRSAELLFDYIDQIEKDTMKCECGGLRKEHKDNIIFKQDLHRKVIDLCECKNPVPLQELSKEGKEGLENCQRYMEHIFKFMLDLYLNIGRTSMSLGATGFMELLKNKFEVNYSSNQKQQTYLNNSEGIKI